MLRRPLAALAVTCLLLTGCARSRPPAGAASSSSSREGGDGASATKPGGSSTGSSLSKARGKAGIEKGATAAGAPAVADDRDRISPPTPGLYHYNLTGSYDPPETGEQPYPADQEETVQVLEPEVLPSTLEYDTEVGATTWERFTYQLIAQWKDDRIDFISTTFRLPGKLWRCVFEPQVRGLPRVLEAQTIKQSWSSPECKGSMTTRITGREKVKDATGREWETWKIEKVFDYAIKSKYFYPIDVRVQSTSWLAPANGLEIRKKRVEDYDFDGEPYHMKRTTVLRSTEPLPTSQPSS